MRLSTVSRKAHSFVDTADTTSSLSEQRGYGARPTSRLNDPLSGSARDPVLS
jgi:hypothetical protein